MLTFTRICNVILSDIKTNSTLSSHLTVWTRLEPNSYVFHWVWENGSSCWISLNFKWYIFLICLNQSDYKKTAIKMSLVSFQDCSEIRLPLYTIYLTIKKIHQYYWRTSVLKYFSIKSLTVRVKTLPSQQQQQQQCVSEAGLSWYAWRTTTQICRRTEVS